MAQHRYRQNKIKREHTIIQGVLDILEQIAEVDAVKSITPGRINPRSRPGDPRVTFQYQTETGLKLLARSNVAVQEVFVVTDEPEVVLKELAKRRLASGLDQHAPSQSPQNGKRAGSGEDAANASGGTATRKASRKTNGTTDAETNGNTTSKSNGETNGSTTSKANGNTNVETNGKTSRRGRRRRPRRKNRSSESNPSAAAPAPRPTNGPGKEPEAPDAVPPSGDRPKGREEQAPQPEPLPPLSRTSAWKEILERHQELLELEKSLPTSLDP